MLGRIARLQFGKLDPQLIQLRFIGRLFMNDRLLENAFRFQILEFTLNRSSLRLLFCDFGFSVLYLFFQRVDGLDGVIDVVRQRMHGFRLVVLDLIILPLQAVLQIIDLLVDDVRRFRRLLLPFGRRILHKQLGELVRDVHRVVTVTGFIGELKRMLAIDFDSDRLLEFIQLLRREVSLIEAISFGFPCSRFQYRFAIQHLTNSP